MSKNSSTRKSSKSVVVNDADVTATMDAIVAEAFAEPTNGTTEPTSTLTLEEQMELRRQQALAEKIAAKAEAARRQAEAAYNYRQRRAEKTAAEREQKRLERVAKREEDRQARIAVKMAAAAEKAEAEAKLLVAIGADSLLTRKGVTTAKRFYISDPQMSADDYARVIMNAYGVENVEVLDATNHSNAWPKQSWLEVRFRILPTEQPAETTDDVA